MKNKGKWISIICCALVIILIIFSTIYFSDNNKEKNNNIDLSNYQGSDKDTLYNAMNTYCKLNNRVNGKMVNLLTLPDLQYLGQYEKNTYNLDLLLDKINMISKLENMDLAITLGDLNNSVENKEVSLKNLKEITPKFKQFAVPTLFTLGNHDRFIINYPEYDITEEEYFNVTFSDFDPLCVFNKNVSNKPYYYKDIENKKMRICVLNSFSAGNYEYVIDEEQLRFVAEEMLDFSDKTNPSEWTIAFFVHTILPTEVHQEYVEGADELFSMLKAYKNGEKFILNEKNEFKFSNNNSANIAAIFTGHHHFNYTFEKDGILVIGLGAIRSLFDRGDTRLYSSWSDNDSDIGFEVISIDTINRVIYSTKF